MMRRKIAGVVVCMLLISAAVFSVAGIMNIDQTEEFLSLSPYNSSDGTCGIVWDTTLNFSEPGGSVTNTVFGEAPDANDGPPVDAYDIMLPPPPMLPYILAWFDDGLPEPYNRLWEDYRQYPDTSKVWDLYVQWMPTDYSTPTDITISWDVNELDGSEYDAVVLYDVIGGTVVANMLVDTDYTFTVAALLPKEFEIVCSLNEPPSFSDETPSDGSVDVPITTSQLTVVIRDPEGDIFDWSIETIPDIGSSNGVGEVNGTKICSVSGLSYSTTYTWYVNATDSGSGTVRGEVYTFTTEVETEPNLDCDGSLTWADVKPGSTVTGSFTVENIGGAGSLLGWEIKSKPEWGIWTITPEEGYDLTPEYGPYTVEVSVVAPDEPETKFTGEVKIINSENPDDFCIIDASLATPVSRNLFILQFLERLMHRFPLLEYMLSSCPFLDRILNLN